MITKAKVIRCAVISAAAIWYYCKGIREANYEDISQGIHKTEKYLILFLSNLLRNDNHSLKNRELHIHFAKAINDTVYSLIRQNNTIKGTEISRQLQISLSTTRRRIKELKERGKIKRIGSDKAGHWEIAE